MQVSFSATNADVYTPVQVNVGPATGPSRTVSATCADDDAFELMLSVLPVIDEFRTDDDDDKLVTPSPAKPPVALAVTLFMVGADESWLNTP